MIQKLPSAKKHTTDYTLIILVVALCVAGLLAIFSATYYKATNSALYHNDGLFFVKNQLKWAVIGLAVMIGISFFDYHLFRRYYIPWIAIGLSVALLVYVLFFGALINDVRRWIVIGPFQFQPVDFAKIGVVVFFAHSLSKTRRYNRNFFTPLVYLGIIGMLFFLVYKQPNFSSAFVLLLLGVSMLFYANCNMATLLAAGGAAVVMFLFIINNVGYAGERFTSFLNPFLDAGDTGYQLVQSFVGLASGGLTGRGFGAGMQKYGFLPYGETDFIFAIIGEDYGYVGCVILIGLFIFLVLRGFAIAKRAPDMFGTLLAAGLTTMIALQVLVNILVATGCMPTTGLPLPFISYGGTSLLSFMICIGMLMNISRQSSV